MLKINVRSIMEDPEGLTADIPAKALDLDSEEAVARGPVHVEASLYRIGEKLFVKGKADVRVKLVCSRCLAEFEQKLEAPFLFAALPAHLHHLVPREEDEELKEDEQAMIVYSGDQIDLWPEVQSALILALPMKPLCQDDCPGLCLECGERLPCSCSK
jgi:uncharacterized protein